MFWKAPNTLFLAQRKLVLSFYNAFLMARGRGGVPPPPIAALPHLFANLRQLAAKLSDLGTKNSDFAPTKNVFDFKKPY